MAESGSRRGAASSTSIILALVAFVAIGGLVYWLDVTAVPTQTEKPTADTTATNQPPASDVPIVTLDQIRSDAKGYEGLEIEVRNQGVNSLLGKAGFWVGPQDKPFLVYVDSAAKATAPQVATGDTVTIKGRVQAMSDSVLDVWQKSGQINGQGERAVASFAEFFLSANQVEKGSPAPAAAPSGGTQGGAGSSAGGAQSGGGQTGGAQSGGAD